METFGDWLIKELETRKMSQADLARVSGITNAQISRIISGTRGAGKNTLASIANALHLPPELIFEKAGVFTAKTDLSPTKRALIYIAKDLPDSDVELAITLLEKRAEYYVNNPQSKPAK